MDSREDWDGLAAGFGALGRLHRTAPDQEVLDAVRAMMDEWPLPGTEAARHGIALMKASADAGENADTVRADHARLYGVFAAALVAPYESVHRGQDKLVFDSQTLQIRQAYRRLGLQAPHLNREPDDHIGLEFDFMAHALDLAGRSRDPREALAAARTVLEDHLLQWAPGMLAAVAEAATTAFMAGVAWLSIGTLDSARQIWS